MKRQLGDRDLWSGVVFAVFGVFALMLGADLTVGNAADMGEGYFPRAMAIALIALGALIILLAWRSPERPGVPVKARLFEGMRWRPLLFVTAAILAFVAALEPLGLIAAIAFSTITANFAGQPLRARPLALLIGVLSLSVMAVFVWGLGLPLHALPRLGR